MSVRRTEYNLFPTQYKFMFGIPYDNSQLNELKDSDGNNTIYMDFALYQGGYTCKKASAEYLSPTGWKTMDKLTKEDKLAVYYPDGHIEFEHPKEVFVWDADEWYELSSRSIHQINCPNHKVYTIKDNKPYMQTMKEYYIEHNNSKHGHRGKFITTFKTSGTLDINETDLRLAIAFQADGYNAESKKYPHQFHLVKERKVNRLKELLKGKDFFIRKEYNGDYRIGTKLNIANKIFPTDWYNLNNKCCEIIADEVKYWDGSIDKKNQTYYSSIESNVDIVQFCVSCAGYKSTKRTRVRKSLASGKDVICHELKYQNNNITPSYYASTNKNVIKHYKANKGEKKYCPSTSTSLWICREFGRITVTGNSGKTFCGALRGLYFALNFSGIHGLVTACTQDLLDGTTKAKYEEHLENIGLKEGVHWWYENRKTLMRFINGSWIMFKTAADSQSFRSFEFGFIELEEASMLTESLFIELIGRLRQQKKEGWDGYYRALFLHTNPQGRRGWIYKRFINPKTRTKSYRYVTASTRENTFLGSEYINAMEEAYSAEQLEELVEGKDVDNDNTVAFPNFSPDNILDDIKPDYNYPLILACDFNYNPMCWYLMQEKNGIWYVLRELIKQNVTTKQMCELIQPALDEIGIRNLIIMGDSHGRDLKTNGSDYGVMLNYFNNEKAYNASLRVQKSNPPVKERLAVLRGYIKNAKGLKRVYIDSKCEWLLYNFDECRNNLGNAGLHIPTDSEIQADDKKRFLIHPIDAMSYPIFYLNNLREKTGEDYSSINM